MLTHHDDRTVFLTIRDLPDEDRPVLIHRSHGVTIAAVDPRDNRLDITMGLVDGLEPEEQDVMRLAFGMTPIGVDNPDIDLISNKPCLLFVPEVLRLPGELGVQGGDELLRRIDLDELADERAYLRDEQMAQAG